MNIPMNERRLQVENELCPDGGRSYENAGLGFKPAFLDIATFAIYPSAFADGRPAPFHLVDGLPEEVVLKRSITGRVTVVKSSVVAGFERKGFFYTRRAAARAIAEWGVISR
jgi:hypothetical protein